MRQASDVTLQINLSAGDIAYAAMTVPPLVAAHRRGVREVVGVVDCCRPQRTQMIDPDEKFPRPIFLERVARIRTIAEQLKRDGLFDRVVYIEEGDERIAELLRKYLGGIVTETHDCYGCGNVSFLWGIDEPSTRFQVHYDADMLLYQAEGYDWVSEALGYLAAEPAAIAATPRVSPPFAGRLNKPDRTSLHESDVIMEARDGYWRVGWWSARCFLLDRDRFQTWLPLLRVSETRYFCEVVARKVLARGYPPCLEAMVHRSSKATGGYRLDLMTERAFVLHPNDKRERFLQMLPAILDSVHRGSVPVEQLGWENLVLDAWESFLRLPRSA